MYPSYQNLSEKERKRQELLTSVEKRLNDDRAKERAYAEAIWASDVEANNIKLFANRTTAGTQTTGTPAGSDQSTPSGTNSFFDGSGSTGATGSFATSSSNSGGPSSFTTSSSNPGGPPSSNFYPTIGSIDESTTGQETSADSSATSISRSILYDLIDDIGDDTETMSDIDDTETPEYLQSIVHNLYSENSELAVLRIPALVKSGNKNTMYLGLDRKPFYKDSNKEVDRSDSLERIDWKATLDYVNEKGRVFGRAREAIDKYRNIGLEQSASDRLRRGAFRKLYTQRISRSTFDKLNPSVDVSETPKDVDMKSINDSLKNTSPLASNKAHKEQFKKLMVNNRELADKFKPEGINSDGTTIGDSLYIDPFTLESSQKKLSELTRKLK